uniref:Uncharacterized protein n=1 Tax=Crocodylus porosus TaxID=8502 RepID=A0A7M4EV33_CROPO
SLPIQSGGGTEKHALLGGATAVPFCTAACGSRHYSWELRSTAKSQPACLGTSWQRAVPGCNTRRAECSRSQPSPCDFQLAPAATERRQQKNIDID